MEHKMKHELDNPIECRNGPFPQRTDITVIPAESQSEIKLGWTIYESKGTILCSEWVLAGPWKRRWLSFKYWIMNLYEDICYKCKSDKAKKEYNKKKHSEYCEFVKRERQIPRG